MEKIGFVGIYGLVCLLAFALCGCADSGILAEKMQTVALEEENGHRVTEPQVPGFLNEEAWCYAYQNLSEAEALWYQDIADCLGKMREEIRLDEQGIALGLEEKDIDKIFQCVLKDHPELFYVEGYTYRKYTKKDKIVAIQFSGTYGMSPEQAIARNEEIQKQVQALLAGAAGLQNDYDKVKYVYETVIYQTEYDLTASHNQNIYSVFVNHKSVCQGYAKAVQYLLERMDVNCTLVFGTVEAGEGHAWNLVQVNDSFYYVDATWGDPSYQSAKEDMAEGYFQEEYLPDISYDYLCITTAQLLRSHVLQGYVPMPECTEDKDNYYVREGTLFFTYDRELMQRVFQRFQESGKRDMTIKCADEQVFGQILNAMVEEQEIFDYLSGDYDSVGYTQNEKQLSMTFWVTNQ